MARLSFSHWRDIVNEYPIYLNYLKLNLFQFQDPFKQFVFNSLSQIFYFAKTLTQHNMHQILYTLEQRIYEKGHIILRQKRECEELFIVQNGEVEMVTSFEGNEFVLDTLYQGSIINHRQFLMSDFMEVTARAKTNCVLLLLTKKTLVAIEDDNDRLKKTILIVTSRLLKESQRYPLDYIKLIPKQMISKVSSQEKHLQVFNRRNQFKNVVFRIILEIRRLRRRPKLSTLLLMVKQQKYMEEAETHDYLKKVATKMFANPTKDQLVQDMKFDRILSSLNRIHRLAFVSSQFYLMLDQKLS